MPDTEPSSEIIMLEQIIRSVSDRLDRLDGNDPAARSLCEHLGELTARRDLLARAQLKSSYRLNLVQIWIWLLYIVFGIVVLLAWLAERTHSLGDDVFVLGFGVLCLVVGVWSTFAAWSNIRRYRRTRAGERP